MGLCKLKEAIIKKPLFFTKWGFTENKQTHTTTPKMIFLSQGHPGKTNEQDTPHKSCQKSWKNLTIRITLACWINHSSILLIVTFSHNYIISCFAWNPLFPSQDTRLYHQTGRAQNSHLAPEQGQKVGRELLTQASVTLFFSCGASESQRCERMAHSFPLTKLIPINTRHNTTLKVEFVSLGYQN